VQSNSVGQSVVIGMDKKTEADINENLNCMNSLFYIQAMKLKLDELERIRPDVRLMLMAGKDSNEIMERASKLLQGIKEFRANLVSTSKGISDPKVKINIKIYLKDHDKLVSLIETSFAEARSQRVGILDKNMATPLKKFFKGPGSVASDCPMQHLSLKR